MAKKYRIKNTNLYHNGHIEKIGSVIELEDDEAKKLEDVLVEVKEKTAPADNSKTATKNSKTKNKTEVGNTKNEQTSEENDNTKNDGGNA